MKKDSKMSLLLTTILCVLCLMFFANVAHSADFTFHVRVETANIPGDIAAVGVKCVTCKVGVTGTGDSLKCQSDDDLVGSGKSTFNYVPASQAGPGHGSAHDFNQSIPDVSFDAITEPSLATRVGCSLYFIDSKGNPRTVSEVLPDPDPAKTHPQGDSPIRH